MTKQELRELRHPDESSRFVLTLVIVVPAVVLAIVAVFTTFGMALLVVGAIVATVWLVARLTMASFLGNAVRVSGDNFPGIHAMVRDCRMLFDYPGQIDVFVYEQSSFNAMLVPLLRRKLILLNADTVANATDNELRWLIARFVGSLASKHYRFMWLQVVLSAIEKIAIFNILLYPYERTVVLSGDQLGLHAVEGDLEAAIGAQHKMLAGGSLGGDIAAKGILRQDRDLQGSFFAWLVKCMSPFPHQTARVTNLLRFAHERYPSQFRAFLARRDEESVRLVYDAIGAGPQSAKAESGTPREVETTLATGTG